MQNWCKNLQISRPFGFLSLNSVGNFSLSDQTNWKNTRVQIWFEPSEKYKCNNGYFAKGKQKILNENIFGDMLASQERGI